MDTPGRGGKDMPLRPPRPPTFEAKPAGGIALDMVSCDDEGGIDACIAECIGSAPFPPPLPMHSAMHALAPPNCVLIPPTCGPEDGGDPWPQPGGSSAPPAPFEDPNVGPDPTTGGGPQGGGML